MMAQKLSKANSADFVAADGCVFCVCGEQRVS